MTSRVLLLLMAVLWQVATQAQNAPDFAEKFMTIHHADTTLHCVTVSPKMIEQMVRRYDDERPESIMQAIAKLKSARIVSGNADHFVQAIELLEKNKNRFSPEKEFRTEGLHGIFFIRHDKKGNTVELIMLREEPQNDRFTIINLTGDIDEQFLCFLYNNKSFKD